MSTRKEFAKKLLDGGSIRSFPMSSFSISAGIYGVQISFSEIFDVLGATNSFSYETLNQCSVYIEHVNELDGLKKGLFLSVFYYLLIFRRL